MPRGPRLDAPGILHHVMVRGIEKREIFRSDDDREQLLARLAVVCEETGAVVYAWCLMPNHFHLAIRTGDKPLSHAMSRLLTGYASYFNRKHRRAGHLFQNRYKSIVVDEERYFLGLVRYIHLNPVRSGSAESIESLATYAWSGHAALLGKASRPWQDVDGVLGRFGGRAGAARRELVVFMGSAEARRDARAFGGGGLKRSAGGSLGAQNARRRAKWAYDERVLGSGRFVEAVLERHEGDRLKRLATIVLRDERFEELLQAAGLKLGVSETELRAGSRRLAVSRARQVLSYLASRELGLSAAAIARELGVSAQSVLKAIAKGASLCAESGWSVEQLASQVGEIGNVP